MKKEYIVPTTEVSVFEAKDIITASLEMGETPGNQETSKPIISNDGKKGFAFGHRVENYFFELIGTSEYVT